MNLRELLGDIVSPEKLRSPRALAVHKYLKTNHALYFRLIECRTKENYDILEIEVSVEVCQHRIVDIKPKERIAIFFNTQGDTLPRFYPLRSDFPRDLLHSMVNEKENLQSLCLWEEPFEELRSRLTPYLLLARLKEWLEKTADGTLHDPEQSLEPVLIGYNYQIIIPIDAINSEKRYVAFESKNACGQTVFRFFEQVQNHKNEKIGVVLIAFKTPEITHRAVRYTPENLQQLSDFLLKIGFDLKSELRKWASEVKREIVLGKAQSVILIEFPKRRSKTDKVESTEYWAFLTKESISALGEALGAFVDASPYDIPYKATLLGDGGQSSNSNLEKFDIFAVAVRKEISSDMLSSLSGYGEEMRPLITAIGAGSLGAKIIELAARCGFGQWAVIDRDIFLPHNLVRHILGKWAIGSPKVEGVRDFVNSLVPGNPIYQTLTADIKNRQNHEEEIESIFNKSDLILDMSASVAVAREVCEYAIEKRRASLFLNPSGKDIVLLLEDSKRKVSLWDLEGTYYKALASDDILQGHLADSHSPTRYGNGCRDLTAQISADRISTLGGIALQQLIQQYKSTEGSATIWRSDIESGGVKAVKLDVTPGIEISLGDWRVRWTQQILDELATQRTQSLPNETGGVLLGIVDFEHKMVVVADNISAPSDSVKRPHYFQRGITGLENTLLEKGRKSADQLKYIGEWHSHPDGIKVHPSDEDEDVFRRLGEVFDDTTEFYLMAILGVNQLFVRMGLGGNAEECCLFTTQ